MYVYDITNLHVIVKTPKINAYPKGSMLGNIRHRYPFHFSDKATHFMQAQ